MPSDSPLLNDAAVSAMWLGRIVQRPCGSKAMANTCVSVNASASTRVQFKTEWQYPIRNNVCDNDLAQDVVN